MADRPKPRTILIEDLPATTDEFGPEGQGSHERVARAITDLILGENGGKFVGLEGTWGSGKSTVVNLIKKQLSEEVTANTTVLLFDAWAHAGDRLRRTFLESLVGQLTETPRDHKQQWINYTKWENRLEELANRRRVTDTKSTPLLTKVGKWFGASAFLVPPGIAILAAGLQTALSSTQNNALAWLFTVFGIFLVLAPMIVLYCCLSGRLRQLPQAAQILVHGRYLRIKPYRPHEPRPLKILTPRQLNLKRHSAN